MRTARRPRRTRIPKSVSLFGVVIGGYASCGGTEFGVTGAVAVGVR
jgi:hypothetical protein